MAGETMRRSAGWRRAGSGRGGSRVREILEVPIFQPAVAPKPAEPVPTDDEAMTDAVRRMIEAAYT